MGYSCVLSVRSIIESLYNTLFSTLVNSMINWNNHFFGLQWYWRPRSCNLGINIIVDSKQVPKTHFLKQRPLLHFLINNYFFYLFQAFQFNFFKLDQFLAETKWIWETSSFNSCIIMVIRHLVHLQMDRWCVKDSDEIFLLMFINY
jgi:hypothetical protein